MLPHFWLVATQTFFIFTPKIGEMIQFDEQIFGMGGSTVEPDFIQG